LGNSTRQQGKSEEIKAKKETIGTVETPNEGKRDKPCNHQGPGEKQGSQGKKGNWQSSFYKPGATGKGKTKKKKRMRVKLRVQFSKRDKKNWPSPTSFK